MTGRRAPDSMQITAERRQNSNLERTLAHPIPDSALDKHVALLGMTGAGKSSVIKTAIVEPDLEADRRVLIITPKDDWWGLRLNRTGKSKGYDIPIFGGWHGDYPLLVKDAALLAETYGTMKGSAIFCTSRLSGQDRARWFAAFAEALLTKNRGWVRVVIDEAHVFMPKQGGKGGGAIPAALHAGNELVSQGRSPGIRIVLASQRSAKLHNDSLTQCSCLIAMMLMAPHDRDAVKDWIADQADPEKGKEIISSLATLNTAEAWVWAPAAKMLEKIQFPWPKTFDSSKAADDDAGGGPTLSPINLDALKGKLASIEAESKANDPKALRAEIAVLKRDLAANAAAAVPAIDPKAVDDAYQNGLAEGLARGESRAKAALAAVESRLKDALAVAGASIESLDSPAPAPLPRRQVVAPPAKTNGHARPLTAPATSPVDGLTAPQRRVMTSLAFWKSIGHETPTREQVAAIAGYRPGSGNFNNLIGGLSTMGQTTVPAPGRLSLNVEFEPLSSDEARDKLWSVFENPQRKLVEAAKEVDGDLSRDELATNAGYAPGSGNFNNIAGKLSSMDVLRRTATGRVALSDWAREVLL
jgi:hypothetical protein